MIERMPATPEAPDPTQVPDAGQTPAHPTGAPWGWPAYPPYPAATGQPAPHPGTIYPPPGAAYPPPGAAYAPPSTLYSPPGAGYTPPGWGQQGAGAPGRDPGKQAKRRSGFLGGLATVGLAILKFGALFAKFGITAATALIAIVAYSLLFGWAFAVGLVLIIFVHEMGHFLTSRLMGVPMSVPIFIPFLGAFTAAGRGFTSDRRREATIAIAGPITGFAATLALCLWALAQPFATSGVRFALSLSYFGFLITLFNLVPMLPLDGGRIASSISKWFNLAGLVIISALLGSQVVGGTALNPILLIIFLFGCYSVWGRFQAARLGREAPPLPVRTRVLIGAGYIALLALSGLFMSLSAGWLTAHNLVNLA